MNTLTLDKQELINQLLAVLETDIQQLEDNLAVLDQLRSLVVKRDNDGLSRLLSQIQSGVNGKHNNETKRQVIRQELAILYGCDIQQITLSRFEKELTGDIKCQISERKTKLQQLTHRIQNEYGSTRRLLSDCERFNKLLLKSVFNLNRSSEIRTYNAAGTTRRQSNAVFMNMQL